MVVYFSNEESLEPHVVSGYVAALPPGSGAIRIRYSAAQRGQVKFAEEATSPEIFEYHQFPGPDWEAPFYHSLTEEDGVDAVLLVGGATSALIAGQIAVARGLPLLAVDEFGGSATKIWHQIALASPQKKQDSWGRRPAAAFVVQLKEECAAAIAQRKERRRREQILANLEAQNFKALYAGGAFILMLVALFFGMVYVPVLSAYPLILFGGLIASGATGALVRAVLSASAETDPRTSSLLGGVAGFIVGLAYIIPQWVGAPGVLEPKASIVTSIDKIQFASAILVAMSAGAGFDTVFSRLQKQAQDAAIGPSR